MKLKTAFKIIIVLSILLPALTVGIVGTYSYYNFYHGMVSEEAASAAYSEAKSQTLFFERYAAMLSTMAQLDQVKRAAGGDYAAIKDQVDQVLNIGGDSALMDMIIMDGTGIVVTNAQSDLNLLQKVFEGYDDPLASTAADGIYVSPIFIGSEKYGTSIIYIVKPVQTSTGSVGYIAAAVDANQLNTSVSSATFFGNAGTIMFVDRAGTGLNVNKEIGPASSSSSYTPESLSGLNDNTRYVSFTEDGYYGAYGIIENTDWIWVGTCSISSVSFSLFPAILFGIIIFAVFIVIDSLPLMR